MGLSYFTMTGGEPRFHLYGFDPCASCPVTNGGKLSAVSGDMVLLRRWHSGADDQ